MLFARNRVSPMWRLASLADKGGREAVRNHRRVEDRGESEGWPVAGRIGDARIALTRKRADFHVVAYREIGLYRETRKGTMCCPLRGQCVHPFWEQGGCSSMAELRLPKPVTWVRFPSPAPFNRRLIWTQCSSIAMSPPRHGRVGTGFLGPTLTKSSRGYRHVLRKQQKQASGGKCAPCKVYSLGPRARKRWRFAE